MRRIDFKGKILIVIMLLYSISIYEIFATPILRLEGLIGTLIFAELAVVAYTPTYFDTFKELLKRPKCNIMPYPHEIDLLIEKSNLNGIKFMIEPDCSGAYSRWNVVCMGEVLLKEFDMGMILAVVAHELGHIKERHSITSILVAYVILGVVYLTFVGPPIILALAAFSLITLTLIPLSRYFEFRSDNFARGLVGVEDVKRVLLTLGEEHGFNFSSETHPSIEKRIARLERLETILVTPDSKIFKQLSGYSILLIVAGIFYFSVSYFTPYYPSFYNLGSNLPWGIITSLFLYDGWANIPFFVMSVALFTVSNFRLPQPLVKKNVIFATVSMFIIGIIGNVYWVTVNPTVTEFGQSGVIYALYGVVFIFCINNTGYLFDDFRIGFKKLTKRGKFGSIVSLFAVLIGLFTLLQIILTKRMFLNIAPGVAYQVHAFTFLLALVIAYAYSIYMGPKTRIESKVVYEGQN